MLAHTQATADVLRNMLAIDKQAMQTCVNCGIFVQIVAHGQARSITIYLLILHAACTCMSLQHDRVLTFLSSIFFVLLCSGHSPGFGERDHPRKQFTPIAVVRSSKPRYTDTAR